MINAGFGGPGGPANDGNRELRPDAWHEFVRRVEPAEAGEECPDEKENLKTAAENLEIALERYKLGNLSGLELREVQLSLLDAEERLLSVQYQAKLAEISLLQISGRMEEYLEIE